VTKERCKTNYCEQHKIHPADLYNMKEGSIKKKENINNTTNVKTA